MEFTFLTPSLPLFLSVLFSSTPRRPSVFGFIVSFSSVFLFFLFFSFFLPLSSRSFFPSFFLSLSFFLSFFLLFVLFFLFCLFVSFLLSSFCPFFLFCFCFCMIAFGYRLCTLYTLRLLLVANLTPSLSQPVQFPG